MWLAFVLLGAAPAFPATSRTPEAAFTKTVQPFLAANCTGCHNSRAKVANLDLQQFTSAESVRANLRRLTSHLGAHRDPAPVRDVEHGDGGTSGAGPGREAADPNVIPYLLAETWNSCTDEGRRRPATASLRSMSAPTAG